MNVLQVDDVIREKLTPEEVDHLFNSKRLLPSCYEDLSKFFEDKTFESGIEIGRNAGWSAIMFTLLYPNAKLTSVDIVTDPTCDQVFKKLGVRSRINMLKRDSRKLKPHSPPSAKCDYALIDGHHSYKSAQHDWRFVRSIMREGGWVLFDNLDHNLGCGRAWEEIKKYPTYKLNENIGVVHIVEVPR